MEYLVFPLPNGGQVAILMEAIVAIWSPKTGNTTFLGMTIDAHDAIEVNASFDEVMAWFDHYIEPGNTATGGDQKDPTKAKRREAVRLVETEVN